MQPSEVLHKQIKAISIDRALIYCQKESAITISLHLIQVNPDRPCSFAYTGFRTCKSVADNEMHTFMFEVHV